MQEVANATLLVHWGRHDKNPEPTTDYNFHEWATKKKDKPVDCPVRHEALLASPSTHTTRIRSTHGLTLR